RTLFEYWGHAASLLPVQLQPLFRWRMDEAREGKNIYPPLARFAHANRPLIEDIRREIEKRGASAVGDFAAHENRHGGWWGWSSAKSALEYLFWAGDLTTAKRGPTFERVYDIPERVLPKRVLDAPTPDERDAKRALIEQAARALGVGTEVCLRDYYRFDPPSAKQAIGELVENDVLHEVTVEGWKKPAYWHTEARCPKTVSARTLLAPFDPLIWHRGRVEALFGTRVRLEIYMPQHKRTHGYYVLPFLLGDRIVGRVDLKADRAAKTLLVLSAHSEPDIQGEDFTDDLVAELHLMARWMGLARVTAHRQGDAAEALLRRLR
ncbi:MAG: crosslink repair DNA glycosylase YcaQ family protein, partial [Pseudomonadota bacterium]